ncbi:MAG: hypothetical protein LW629_10210 [Burkholderiales bacterium]|jgi:hypothetical protein|nr:hypothetical protein [Burkholderiales bacterium]
MSDNTLTLSPADVSPEGTINNSAVAADAKVVVGKTPSGDITVVRNGSNVTLKTGDPVLKGDLILPSPGAGNTLVMASNTAGETTEVSLPTDQSVALSDDFYSAGETVAVAEADVESQETSGLFGGLAAAASLSGGGAAIGLAAVGVAAAGGGGGGDSSNTAPAPAPSPLDPGLEDSNPPGGGAPAPSPAGPFSEGAAMLADALPLEMIPTAGPMIEAGLVSGAAQLESMAPANSNNPLTEIAAGLAGGQLSLPTALASPVEDLLAVAGNTAGISSGAADPSAPPLPAAPGSPV